VGALRYVRDGVVGLILASVIWVSLAATQTAWGDATNDPRQNPLLPALGLVAAGAFLVALISWSWLSGLTLLVAASVLLVLLGPLVLQLGSWGPDWLVQSALQIGTSSGTFVALGVLLAGAVVSLSSRGRDTRIETSGERPPETPRGSG